MLRVQEKQLQIERFYFKTHNDLAMIICFISREDRVNKKIYDQVHKKTQFIESCLCRTFCTMPY